MPFNRRVRLAWSDVAGQRRGAEKSNQQENQSGDGSSPRENDRAWRRSLLHSHPRRSTPSRGVRSEAPPSYWRLVGESTRSEQLTIVTGRIRKSPSFCHPSPILTAPRVAGIDYHRVGGTDQPISQGVFRAVPRAPTRLSGPSSLSNERHAGPSKVLPSIRGQLTS
jgi:hypothetical protein